MTTGSKELSYSSNHSVKKKKKPTWVIMRTQTAKYINDEEGDGPSDSETLFLKPPLQVLPGFSLKGCVVLEFSFVTQKCSLL